MAITYSMISNNFVLHVPVEYDYYLCSKYKIEFILKLIEIREFLKYDPIKFYFVDDIDLTKFTKTDNEVKMKYPKVKFKALTLSEFEEFI